MQELFLLYSCALDIIMAMTLYVEDVCDVNFATFTKKDLMLYIVYEATMTVSCTYVDQTDQFLTELSR